MLPSPLEAVIIVAGPTGSGKSALALALAEALGGIVINADAMQVYRELRVLTARPTPADEARVPHRLFGFLPAVERCSVGRWLALARAEIDACHALGRLPIVVGGTGLYLKALTEGLSRMPPVPDAVRAEAEALYDRLGGEDFRRVLSGHDPAAAARLAAGDRQRLCRALAVALATGRALTDWQRLDPPRSPLTGRPRVVILLPERSRLYCSLDARFTAMLEGGAIDEVRALLALDLDPGLPAMRAVGVPEITAYLQRSIGLAEARAAGQRATRRYAKRQYTWLRHQLTGDCVINEQYSSAIAAQTLARVRAALLTPRA